MAIAHALCVNVALFADDAKIYRRIESLDDCILLQNDLLALDIWSNTWKLQFNHNKCKVLQFARVIKHNYNYKMNDTMIEQVSNFNDLGINVTFDLDWQTHIHQKVSKANSTLAFIKRTYGYSAAPEAKRMLYLTLIRSGLLYGSTIWYPNKSCKKLLEGTQRRATKYILGDYESDYKMRLQMTKLIPLSYYKESRDMCFLYKCIHGYYSLDVHTYLTLTTNIHHRTRSTVDDFKINIENAKTEKAKEFFFHRVVKPWNIIPYNIRSQICSSKEITPVKRWLMNHYMNLTQAYFEVENVCTWVSFCRCSNCRPV